MEKTKYLANQAFRASRDRCADANCGRGSPDSSPSGRWRILRGIRLYEELYSERASAPGYRGEESPAFAGLVRLNKGGPTHQEVPLADCSFAVARRPGSS